MAERRMFAKTIVDSDAFLDMPLSSQALYFHLSMRADDDGFINNPKKIQRMIGSSDDDLRILIAKRFILSFDTGVIVIKHWKIHNWIRGDRKKDTIYQKEKELLDVKNNGSYTLTDKRQTVGSQVVVQMDTQVRLGKDRLDNNMSISDEILDGDFEEVKPEPKKQPKQLESDFEKLWNNVQNEQHSGKNAKALESDFEKLWKLYPNKKGKQSALKAYKRAIKDGVSNKQIQDGIVAYKKYLAANGTDQQYMMHGGTFFNQRSWDDDWSISQSQPTNREKVPENLIDDIYNSQ